MTFRIWNTTRNAVLATHVVKAETLFHRMKGLLGSKNLLPGHGLWIVNCNSIHTFFMKFPIDVVFLTKDARVVKMYRKLMPFRLTPWVHQAESVLELPAGTLAGNSIRTGDQLLWEARQ